jgi:hypothetical protein
MRLIGEANARLTIYQLAFGHVPCLSRGLQKTCPVWMNYFASDGVRQSG